VHSQTKIERRKDIAFYHAPAHTKADSHTSSYVNGNGLRKLPHRLRTSDGKRRFAQRLL